jgi:hypothetical protein
LSDAWLEYNLQEFVKGHFIHFFFTRRIKNKDGFAAALMDLISGARSLWKGKQAIILILWRKPYGKILFSTSPG